MKNASNLEKFHRQNDNKKEENGSVKDIEEHDLVLMAIKILHSYLK